MEMLLLGGERRFEEEQKESKKDKKDDGEEGRTGRNMMKKRVEDEEEEKDKGIGRNNSISMVLLLPQLPFLNEMMPTAILVATKMLIWWSW